MTARNKGLGSKWKNCAEAKRISSRCWFIFWTTRTLFIKQAFAAVSQNWRASWADSGPHALTRSGELALSRAKSNRASGLILRLIKLLTEANHRQGWRFKEC